MNPSSLYILKKNFSLVFLPKKFSEFPCDIPREENQNILNQKPVSGKEAFGLPNLSPSFLLHSWILNAGAEGFLQTQAPCLKGFL